MLNRYRRKASVHPIARCLERYGIKLSYYKYTKICEHVKEKKRPIFIEQVKRYNNDRILCKVRVKNITMLAIFSTRTNTVVTFLPFEDGQKKLPSRTEQCRSRNSEFVVGIAGRQEYYESFGNW